MLGKEEMLGLVKSLLGRIGFCRGIGPGGALSDKAQTGVIEQ